MDFAVVKRLASTCNDLDAQLARLHEEVVSKPQRNATNIGGRAAARPSEENATGIAALCDFDAASQSFDNVALLGHACRVLAVAAQ